MKKSAANPALVQQSGGVARARLWVSDLNRPRKLQATTGKRRLVTVHPPYLPFAIPVGIGSVGAWHGMALFARLYHFAGLVGFPMRRLYPAAFTTPSNGGWIMFGKHPS